MRWYAERAKHLVHRPSCSPPPILPQSSLTRPPKLLPLIEVINQSTVIGAICKATKLESSGGHERRLRARDAALAHDHVAQGKQDGQEEERDEGEDLGGHGLGAVAHQTVESLGAIAVLVLEDAAPLTVARRDAALVQQAAVDRVLNVPSVGLVAAVDALEAYGPGLGVAGVLARGKGRETFMLTAGAMGYSRCRRTRTGWQPGHRSPGR
jgi:hypothetical protein